MLGELFPRGGFIVTNLETDSRAVVRFYNKRGTAERGGGWSAAAEDGQLAADELAATVGKDWGQADRARAVPLADPGGEASDQAAVWEHGAAGPRGHPGAAGGDRIARRRWAQRNQADKDVRVGEVRVECAEKTGFPGFGFSRQGEIAAWASQRRLPEKRLHWGGSKVGGLVYT
jgi:hypothetical protein